MTTHIQLPGSDL